MPEEFLYDPVSKTYGDPSRRPECKVGLLFANLTTFDFPSNCRKKNHTNLSELLIFGLFFGKVCTVLQKIQTGLGGSGVGSGFFLSQYPPKKNIPKYSLQFPPFLFFLFPVGDDRVHRPFRVHAPPPAAGSIRVLPGRLTRGGGVGVPAGLLVFLFVFLINFCYNVLFLSAAKRSLLYLTWA